jgi:type II secretory pathway pseudopilin PulG
MATSNFMPAFTRTPIGGRNRRRRGTPSAHSRPGSDAGFTLIEVLIGAVVLIVGIATLFGLLDASVKASYQTRAREGATNLARQILEDARTIPYAQINPTSITEQLQAMNGLADSSEAPGWQISRRGITYTVTVSECSIDDPKDGLGVHDSTFCKDPGEKEGTEDAQPADLKRITVDVKWTAIGRSPDVRQVSTLTAAGEGVGLSASSLQLSAPKVSAPAAPVVITEPAGNLLTFTFTAPSSTTGTIWSLDGVRRASEPTLEKGTTTWTFTWNIAGLSDGLYKVTVQAVDASGVVGPPLTIPVTLIRGAPSAPKVTAGGFNTVNVAGSAKKVVELQWQANSERNVIGYRVYNPSNKRVCPAEESTLSLALSCIDLNPPAPTETKLTYTVVALYRKAEKISELLSEKVSEGAVASFTVAGGEPPPPGPNVPASPLTLAHNADGSVTLSWSAPKGGPAVSFYRIYRGGTNYNERYDVTASGAVTTYTDTDAAGEHSYWVTAVGSNLTESPFLGPVAG